MFFWFEMLRRVVNTVIIFYAMKFGFDFFHVSFTLFVFVSIPKFFTSSCFCYFTFIVLFPNTVLLLLQ